jgi:hypothetical protein
MEYSDSRAISQQGERKAAATEHMYQPTSVLSRRIISNSPLAEEEAFPKRPMAGRRRRLNLAAACSAQLLAYLFTLLQGSKALGPITAAQNWWATAWRCESIIPMLTYATTITEYAWKTASQTWLRVCLRTLQASGSHSEMCRRLHLVKWTTLFSLAALISLTFFENVTCTLRPLAASRPDCRRSS